MKQTPILVALICGTCLSGCVNDSALPPMASVGDSASLDGGELSGDAPTSAGVFAQPSVQATREESDRPSLDLEAGLDSAGGLESVGAAGSEPAMIDDAEMESLLLGGGTDMATRGAGGFPEPEHSAGNSSEVADFLGGATRGGGMMFSDSMPADFGGSDSSLSSSPSNGSSEQTDLEVAEDHDLDGIPNGADNCPNTPNLNQLDMDGDNAGDACDEAPSVFNYRLVSQLLVAASTSVDDAHTLNSALTTGSHRSASQRYRLTGHLTP